MPQNKHLKIYDLKVAIIQYPIISGVIIYILVLLDPSKINELGVIALIKIYPNIITERLLFNGMGITLFFRF